MKDLKKIPTIEQLSKDKINENKKDDTAKAKEIFTKLGKDSKIKWSGKDYYLTKVTNDFVTLSNEPYSENKQSVGISVEHKEFVEKFKDKLNEGFEEGEVVLIDPKQKEELKSKGRTDDELNAEWEVMGYDGSNLRVRPIGDTDTANVISLADSRFVKKEKTNEALSPEEEAKDIAKWQEKSGYPVSDWKEQKYLTDSIKQYQNQNGVKVDPETVNYIKSLIADDKLDSLTESKVDESFSISAGNAKIESKEQALALIPAQKEVDDELVDFEEGEKITVSGGENEYKFVWEGGKAVDAPEEEPMNEEIDYVTLYKDFGDEMNKILEAVVAKYNVSPKEAVKAISKAFLTGY